MLTADVIFHKLPDSEIFYPKYNETVIEVYLYERKINKRFPVLCYTEYGPMNILHSRRGIEISNSLIDGLYNISCKYLSSSNLLYKFLFTIASKL